MNKISHCSPLQHTQDGSSAVLTCDSRSIKTDRSHFIPTILTLIPNMRLISKLFLLFIFISVPQANAYQLYNFKWPQPTTAFYVNIGGANGLWNTAFENAMALWSANTIFEYTIFSGIYEDPCDLTENGRNGVGLGATNCGDAWGRTTLATTHISYRGSTAIQTDIVFNSNESWNVYSTSWQSSTHDFQRVAVHELGHALGLGHDDSGVITIMGTYAGNITTPQQDDINGVAALYGSLGNLVVSKSGSGTVTSAPAGIRCGAVCSGTFTSATNITLTATADAGWYFTGWSGGVCSGASTTCTVSMVGDKAVTAAFTVTDSTLKPTPEPTPTPSSSDGGGGCFIATAAYGSYFDPYVKILRNFRDTFLLTNHPGQSFVAWYYKVSPPIADSVKASETMKAFARIMLLPAVGFAYLCLNVGVAPGLLIIIFSIAIVCLGIKCPEEDPE